MQENTRRTPSRPRVEYLGSRIYWVGSRSEPGTGRLVDLNHHTCSCPAYTKGHRDHCVHRTLAGQVECAREALARQARDQHRAAAGSLAEAFGPFGPSERAMSGAA